MRKNFTFTMPVSAPYSSSSAAALNVAAFVLRYWKQPVSVVTAIYSRSASSCVMPPHISFITASTISPQAALSGQTSSFFA